MKYFIVSILIIFGFHSTAQWNEIQTNVTNEWYEVEVFENDVIYLLTLNKIAKSSDGGVNWNFTEPSHSGYFTAFSFVDSNTGWLTSSFGEIIYTDDACKNWTTIATETAYWKDVFFLNSKLGWATTSAGEIFKTTDGGINWLRVYMIPGEIAEHISFTDINNGWCCTYEGSFAFTTDGGSNWQINQTQDVYNCFFNSPELGWGVDYYGNVLRTNDGGENWTKMSTGFSYQLTTAKYVSKYEGWTVGGSDCSGSSCIPYHKILFTKDGGASWENQDIPTATSNMRVNDIDFVKLSGNDYKIYICGAQGKLWVNDYSLSGLENLICGEGVKVWIINNLLILDTEKEINHISIFGIDGKLVYETDVAINAIDISNLNKGFFILKLDLDSYSEIVKFIK